MSGPGLKTYAAAPWILDRIRGRLGWDERTTEHGKYQWEGIIQIHKECDAGSAFQDGLSALWRAIALTSGLRVYLSTTIALTPGEVMSGHFDLTGTWMIEDKDMDWNSERGKCRIDLTLSTTDGLWHNYSSPVGIEQAAIDAAVDALDTFYVA